MPMPVLDAMEQRILGSLLEKQATVPASYPLSLNGVRVACNQSSSRDPIVEYTDSELELCLRALKTKGLVRAIWTDGSRSLKYHQLLSEALGLADDERAVLTVLLLRGPNSPGELKTRTDRLHSFTDRTEVEATLDRLADRDEPLVVRLERRPGQQDHRWAHLLGPLPSGQTQAAPPVVDSSVVIADGSSARDARVLAAYDAVATAYAERYADELSGKPFDRWLLAHVADLVDGPLADVGCGPGQTTAQLAAAGADVTGYDLSSAMIDAARHRFGDCRFEVADFRRLLRPRTASAWAGITAWYAFVHLATSEVAPALRALGDVLAPGGVLAFALHEGHDVRRVTRFLDHDVEVDFVFHDKEAVLGAVEAAGLEVDQWYLRGPLDGVETDTDRLYVVARKP